MPVDSAITVDPLNAACSTLNGVLFHRSRNTLWECPPGKAAGLYTVPDGVTSIGDSAFNSCTNLGNGTNYFSDAQWTNCPARFYRVRSRELCGVRSGAGTNAGNYQFRPRDGQGDGCPALPGDEKEPVNLRHV